MKIPVKIILWQDKATFEAEFKDFALNAGISYIGTLNEKGFDGILDSGDKELMGMVMLLNKTIVDGNLVMDFGKQIP